ncbi:MAG: helix-turn-helix transcriptional regulator [Gammaproteobacteria bacterium]
MNVTTEATDAAILGQLGSRLARHRLQRNMTQAQAATVAGLSKRTVERIEAGESTQLTNLVRLFRALGLDQQFAALVPELPPSPIQQLDSRSKGRRRASSRRNAVPVARAWSWKEEK